MSLSVYPFIKQIDYPSALSDSIKDSSISEEFHHIDTVGSGGGMNIYICFNGSLSNADITVLTNLINDYNNDFQRRNNMSVTNFPDGIKIGPDIGGNDRLPLYEFDEYSTDSIVFGTMAAGAHQTVVINDVPNVRAGASVFARLMNPSYLPHLLIQHSWASANNQVSVMVRNLNSSSVAFENDMINLTIFNTSTP